MNKALVAMAVVSLVACAVLYAADVSSPKPKPAPASAPTQMTQQQKVGYCIGLSIAQNIKRQGLPADPVALLAGMKDGLTGAKPKMTQEEVRQTMMAFQERMMARQKKAAEAMKKADAGIGEANRKAGAAYLAENRKKPGVVVAASGLQYKVLKPGTGAKPKATDWVVVKYRGTLVDGTEFDNSANHGGTARFRAGGVIQGWSEALQLMKVGAKWQLVVPSGLAYGERRKGPKIGPNSTLVFEVELLKIEGDTKK